MPAMLESMFYVKEDGLPWHSLGNSLDNPPTTEQGIIDAGLDWPVDLIDLRTVDGLDVPARATVRTVNGRRDVLGVVGESYVPLQNRDAFKWFDPFILAKECRLCTAGSLYDGKRIWILAKLNRDNSVIVGEDEIAKYLMLAHSHDGTLSIFVGLTPIRIVCANTMSAALGDKNSALCKIRHTASAANRLLNIHDTVDSIDADFEATALKYRFLAGKNLTSEQLGVYLRKVFQVKLNDKGVIPTRSKNKVDEVTKLFASGLGNNLPGVRGTWWAAYNAVTQSLSYDAGRNANNRLASLWFGINAETNKRALETALAMAA